MRRTWSWDVYHVATGVGVAALLLGDDDVAPARRSVALAILVALAVLYAVVGRPLCLRDDRSLRGVAFMAGVVVLFAAGVSLMSTVSVALFALCPMAYMTLPVGRAGIAVALLNATLPVVQVANGTPPAHVLRGAVPIAVAVTAFSVIIGGWIDGVERQNREKAELIRHLEASRAQVARLSHDAGVAAERQRLAGDIHDTIAQGLSSVIMLIQAAQPGVPPASAAWRHLDLALATARDNLAEARALVAALPPAELDGAPLAEALRRVVQRQARDAGAAVTFDVDGTTRPLPTPAEVVLLRAAQEALTNVRKHSGARTAHVRLGYAPDFVVLEVRDDGTGIGGDAGGGYGLTAMRGRVEEVRGSLTVTSASGRGTLVRVEVPA
ncbi:MAG: sensor histidine kinase [Hamadaea sp.]|nr:sensor histidine kinase [Hamadaea sp.]